MEGDQLKKQQEEIDKLGKVLHNKSGLPSLRSYQGDMAQFIRDTNASVTSIALKEKARKEEREEKVESPVAKKAKNISVSFSIILLSLVLLAAGGAGVYYIVKAIEKRSVPLITTDTEVLPYNNLIEVVNVTPTTLRGISLLEDLKDGVNIIKISDTNNEVVNTFENLAKFAQMSLPSVLRRNIEEGFAFGVFRDKPKDSLFLVIKISSFGSAFSGMLEWEKTMRNDLAFLVESQESSSTTPTFTWKDMIIKNKDSRGLIDSDGNLEIVYTFLDRNTVLITDIAQTISKISDIYVSRAVVR